MRRGELDAAVAAAVPDMVATRRDLHRHPELGFEERRTTGVVRDRLGGLALDERRCPTPTGAVFELRGGRPGATVLLRADLDALPIVEPAGAAWASEHRGVMHACGHDAHVAALLGVAQALAPLRAELAGRFVFVFQPAEESVGGAQAMLDGGLLDDLGASALVGCHVTSMAPVGLVAVRAGIAMSEVHSFAVRATGSGGHGAIAGAQGNVLLALADLAGKLGRVTEGMAHDGTSCACSAGVLAVGSAANVVASEGVLRGTLRTFTAEQAPAALAALREACATIGSQYGCTLELEVEVHASAVVNDPSVTDVVERVAVGAVGEDRVVRVGPAAPSDDVSEFLAVVPGCYFFVGAARPDGTSGPHHSPTFAVDDGCLEVAARTLAGAAVELASA